MHRVLFRSLPPLLLAVACSSEPPSRGSSPETLASSSSAIINGTIDTTHPAVVAMGSSTTLCSGTIVKTDPLRRIGWVLTAAHCVSKAPVFVIQGQDYMAANVVRYDVIDYRADPRYTGVANYDYDFAIVRIAGVDSATPV